MDFSTMPPEIISGRMYSGPGSSSMVASASAWSALSAELHSMATSYQAMITQLASEEWLGPASGAMVAAAKPYLNWLTVTAAQAEQSTTQARMAAAAFEQAYAMTVPPAVISANRALLQQLITTNFLGQNASAIATTEAQYGEMWAQDSLAMHTYAAQSAAAGKLESFAPPPQTTNLAGSASQAGAVAHAAGSAAADKTLTSMPDAVNMLGTTGGADPSSAAAVADTTTTATDAGSSVFDDPAVSFGQESLAQSIGVSSIGANSVNAVWRGLAGVVGAAKLASDGAAKAATGAAGAAAGAASGAAAAGAGGLGALGGVGSGLGGVAGGLGNAGMIGGLSVPPSWASGPVAAAAPLGPVSGGTWEPIGGSGLMGATPEAAPHGMPGVPGAPAAGTAAGMAGRSGGFGMGPRYGFKVPVMPRLPGIG